MQNSSVAVPDRLRFVDPEPEHHLSLFRTPDFPTAQGPALPSGAGSVCVRPSVFRTRHALVLSLMLHVVALLLWSFGEMHKPPPTMSTAMEARLVTWTDVSRSSDKKHHSADAIEATEAPVHQPSIDQSAPTRILSAHAALVPDAGTASLSAAHAAPGDTAVLASDELSTPPSAESAGYPSSLSSQRSSDSDASKFAYSSLARPRYSQNAPPAYPALARLRGHEGIVIINAEILPEGKAGIVKIKSSSGYMALDQSALDAVRTWTFEPARKRGRAVAAWVDIPVRFVLKKSD